MDIMKVRNTMRNKTGGELKWWQKTIAYEIYVRSFKDSNGDGIGDLNGITSELDHLKDLGVGAIWLTPCYVSPQADNGYDIADYYRIDPAYGTMEDMERLIAEAKKRGIRIVMDLVFNHTSDQNEWFQSSRRDAENDKSDWYIWADPKEDGSAPTNWRSIFGGSAWTYDEGRKQYYLHTFLPEQPDLNWANPAVREELQSVAKFWVNKGVGGFRMDAITYIKKPEHFRDGEADAKDALAGIHAMTANTDGILDYLHEFKSAVQDGTDIFTVGEANGVFPDQLPDWIGENGVFDMIFQFGLVDIDLPDENNWCETCSWSLKDFKSFFADSLQSCETAGGWFPVVLENHDQPRSISHFFPKDDKRDARAKALATLLLTMRGTPFIMQGEELGFENVSWQSIEDFDDISTKNHYAFSLAEGYSKEQALESVLRFSRDSSRTPMQWEPGKNAGFSTSKPWLPVYPDHDVYNRTSEKKDPGSVLNHYIRLAALRRTCRELTDGDYAELMPENEQIFSYRRMNESRKATIFINFTNREVSYDPACISDAEWIFGTEQNAKKGLLRPYEAVIYEAPVS